MFYFCPSTSADFLLFFITIPSIPFLGSISNFDLLGACLLGPLISSLGISNDDRFKHDFLAVLFLTVEVVT